MSVREPGFDGRAHRSSLASRPAPRVGSADDEGDLRLDGRGHRGGLLDEGWADDDWADDGWAHDGRGHDGRPHDGRRADGSAGRGSFPPGRGNAGGARRRRASWLRFVVLAVVVLVALIALLLWRASDGDGTATDADAAEPGAQQPAATSTPPVASTVIGDGAAAGGAVQADEVEFVDVDPLTFWIDPANGDEANDGQTPDRPWRSLQGALDRVEPGQTLFLMTGDHTGSHDRSAHFVAERGGTPDAWVTITAGPGERPVIAATSGNGLVVRASYVEVSGLEIRGEGFSESNPYGWGLLGHSAHHIRFVDNVVSGMAVGGIGAIETANLEVRSNEIYENSFWGTEQGSGISIWHATDHGTEPTADGYHDLIVDNVVYRNENKVNSRFRSEPAITDGNGIIVDQTDETGYTGRTLVANNLVFDNGGRAVLVLESSRVDVVHNTTFGNGRTEQLEGGPVELAAGRASDVRFFNNLAWSRDGKPALVYNTSTDVVTGGNLLVSSNQGPYTSASDVVVAVDPGLVAPGIDLGSADFSPRPGSTATQVGVGLDRPIVVDANGLPRPAIGAVGAFEPASGSVTSSD
ncbi:MAG: right-handed parallel beta-helix repeat-containing protein [Actinomycetota bacterium]